MKRVLLAAAILVTFLAACSSNGAGNNTVEGVAKQQMSDDGFGTANITKVTPGDPAVVGADELYCVATDATTQNGELPYLLMVWRKGSDWQAKQLEEGYYEWDLQGCTR